MILEGSHHFNAPRDRVWAAFTDPAVLARATPGCERLDPVGPDEFEATLSVGVAAVKGIYEGKLAITDKNPPEGYTLRVEGSGRPGFVKGEGRLTLAEQDGGTLVSIRAEAQVGGLIAAVGQRLLGAATRMLIEQFFSALEVEINKATA
ncbi:MAG: carbon monoxide dehydrogenase subunit G [Candidatus Rokubacteria bacterium]|nr:carbon monoxide dehydrogenase subunit G [Candidatus Rokubacteria bacterium]